MKWIKVTEDTIFPVDTYFLINSDTHGIGIGLAEKNKIIIQPMSDTWQWIDRKKIIMYCEIPSLPDED